MDIIGLDRRIVYRYSDSFKQKVVSEIENGQLSFGEAQRRYGIGGSTTIQKWIRKMGKNDLLCKKVRIETMEEVSQLESQAREIARLKELIVHLELERFKSEQFLSVACQDLGVEVESFKKKDLKRPKP